MPNIAGFRGGGARWPSCHIFRAERATARVITSGTRADEINRGPGNYGELFGSFQGALTTEATLAIARIYDLPDRRFPTRCLIGVLDFLAAHQDELPPIRGAYQLELSLKSDEFSEALIRTVQEQLQDFADVWRAYSSFIAVPETLAQLRLIKRLRDKPLAYNEHVAPFEGPTWNARIDLTNLEKQTIGVLWAYFNTGYAPNGQHLMTEDVLRPLRALERLINNMICQTIGHLTVPSGP